MLAPRFGGLLKANPQLCVVAPNYLAGLRCPIWHDALKRSGNPESGLHHKTCANFREVAHRARDFALPSMIVPDLSIRLRGAFRRSSTAIIALRGPGSSAEKGWCPLSLPAPPIGSVAPLSNDSDVQRAGMGAPMLLCRKVTGAPAAALALGARERPLDHLSPVTITEWLRRATVDATGSAAWRSSRPSSMLRLASAGSPPIAGRAHPQSRNRRAPARRHPSR
jgi:hypothetical protein